LSATEENISAKMPRVIVVGAGVSGLSAAWRLQQLGNSVTVLESEGHVGGKTTAYRRDGFTLNSGAAVLGASYTSMQAIARELGVESQIIKINPTIGVYAVPEHKVHWLRGAPPGALIDFIRTPLLSWRSKLVLAKAGVDAIKARKKAGYDQPQLRAELDTESVAAYCDRRLNAEIRDRLMNPLMGGLFVVDGGTVSVASLFFSLVKFLGGGMNGYNGGIDFFARALGERLDVTLNARVTHVERNAAGAKVTWNQATNGVIEEHEEQVDGVILAIAAPQVPPVYPGLDPRLQGILLEGLKQANYISVRIALKRKPDTDALLVVVPFGALGGIGTVTYEHNINPGAAPPGKGIVGVLLYHEWVTPRLTYSDDEIISETLGELDKVIPGVADDVEFAQITRWEPAALLGDPGTHKLIAEVDRLIDPDERVQLAGDFLSIPSIEGSIVTGEAAAKRLSGALTKSMSYA
jgi:oxygen-dependent protoporphyrinogen oxidase